MKKLFYVNLFLLLFIFSLYGEAESAVINAASCSQADVQTAIASAYFGDTVSVPAGECTWTNNVILPAGVILQGAGIGQTIITRSNLAIAVSMGNNSRLTGFEFTNASLRATEVQGWRIDHCKITWTSVLGNGIIFQGGTSANSNAGGLVDNCTFVNVRLVNYGTYGYSDVRWFEEAPLGNPTGYVYVEDCTWNNTTQTSTVDGNLGGRYVARFNTLNNAYFEGHGAKTSRGIHKWEIYRNTINNVYPPMVVLSNIRGGTGVIFDNTCTGSSEGCRWIFGLDRASTSYSYSGQCDGTSSWDSNELTPNTGWLCRDQIGAGKDSQLGSGVASLPPYAQAKTPTYIWNLTYNGNPANFYVAYGATRQLEDRDFYLDDSSNPNYGNGGVSIGILANIPSTCTPYQGYWATDQGNWNKKVGGQQGVLYKCTATDTWTAYYTPLTYPHPLRRIPSSVQGLRIQGGN